MGSLRQNTNRPECIQERRLLIIRPTHWRLSWLLALTLLIVTLACRLVVPDKQARPDRSDHFPIAVIATPSLTASNTSCCDPTGTPTPTATATQLPLPTPTETLVPTATDSPAPLVSPTERPTPSALQLQVFEEVWTTVNENYLYRDFNGQNWEAIGEAYRAEVEAGISDEEFYLLMDEMIASLGDEHSIFFSPDDAKAADAEYAGEYDYVGIGVLTSVVPERFRVTVLLVFPGSPAEKAGLQIHDSLLAVDGAPLVDDEGFRRQLLRGPEGSSLELTVQTPGEEPRTIQLIRQRINSSLPVPFEIMTSPQGQRIGYLLLATFNDVTVGDQVKKALQAMSAGGPLDGLVIDNRMNGGGASNVLSTTLGYFTKGIQGYFVQRDQRRALNVIGQDVAGSMELPLVVLVGEETASFGEIFAGILKDTGRATILGDVTRGNVEVLWIYDFSDGSRAWIAHETFRPLNQKEENWEETGIIPDQLISSNWDEVTLETDPVVKAALDHFDAAR